MINKYLTCKTRLPLFGGETIVARLDSDATNMLHTVHEHGFDKHYMTGEIAERLYAYEKFGYTPEEIREIIDRDRLFRDLEDRAAQLAVYTRLVNSTYGASAALGRVTASCQNHDDLRAKVTLVDEMHLVEPDEYMTTTKWPKKNPYLPKTDDITIDKVIFNDPATIVYWSDGTKTVVKAENEAFDPEKGLAMAIAKKSLGNKGNYYEVFKKWVPKKEEPVKTDTDAGKPSKPMTYREKLQQEHPDKVRGAVLGGCMGCPSDYGYGPERWDTCRGCSPSRCKKCWNKVIPDNKKEG